MATDAKSGVITVADLSRGSELIKRAYVFAERAHTNQKRMSGEPHFTHVLATAKTLREWSLDDVSIAAGLLHDVVEDTPVTASELQAEFGSEISALVEGVTKISSVKYQGHERQVENLRKMILAMAEDLRVILIKLADRRHNMQTLNFLPAPKRRRIALETAEIYAPLAYRLGMQGLSGELEDLAFPYTHPSEYKWLIQTIRYRYNEREAYLKQIQPIVEKMLAAAGVNMRSIDFRAKRYSSLYKKLLRHEMNLERIYDLIAFRIIVETVEDCYAALGVIHNLWPPMPGRIKDYIAMPKPNGYRSLHTTVICVDNKLVEFQIRTAQMHEEAENGIAAHWAYEESKRTKQYIRGRAVTAAREETKWVEQLRSWQKDFSTPSEFIDALKIDFLKDRIFAITPTGDVIDLPYGATPVDFAYQIHTQVGDQCIGAKVNGTMVPLNHKLESSDVVEIITQKGKKPSFDWLDFVATSAAKAHIKNVLKDDRRKLRPTRKQQIEIRLKAEDRVGIIKDVSAIVSRSHVSIIRINSESNKGLHTIRIVCDTDDKERIMKIILRTKTLKGIKEIDYRFV